jgi:hypothetical protein
VARASVANSSACSRSRLWYFGGSRRYEVAVDQHQPIALGDHHHRYLLADLGHRRDQSTAASSVADPQVVVPQPEPVQVDVHAGHAAGPTSWPPSRFAQHPDHVFRNPL